MAALPVAALLRACRRRDSGRRDRAARAGVREPCRLPRADAADIGGDRARRECLLLAARADRAGARSDGGGTRILRCRRLAAGRTGATCHAGLRISVAAWIVLLIGQAAARAIGRGGERWNREIAAGDYRDGCRAALIAQLARNGSAPAALAVSHGRRGGHRVPGDSVRTARCRASAESSPTGNRSTSSPASSRREWRPRSWTGIDTTSSCSRPSRRRCPAPRAVVDELRRRIPPRQIVLADPRYSCATRRAPERVLHQSGVHLRALLPAGRRVFPRVCRGSRQRVAAASVLQWRRRRSVTQNARCIQDYHVDLRARRSAYRRPDRLPNSRRRAKARGWR